jgi:uncharacterized protein with HEPN domain
MPEKIVETYPSLPWAQMRGMRNHLIHEYFRVAPKILWDTIQHDLPPVGQELRSILFGDPG